LQPEYWATSFLEVAMPSTPDCSKFYSTKTVEPFVTVKFAAQQLGLPYFKVARFVAAGSVSAHSDDRVHSFRRIATTRYDRSRPV
jgi:hypothetical protein